MSKINIPLFLTSEFRALETKEEREEFAKELRIWKNSKMTEYLMKFLEDQIKISEKKEDEDTGFLSRFQLTYSIAHRKGYRSALRQLINQLGA